MNSMFNGCSSLVSLPDLSKWDKFDKIFEGYYESESQLFSLKITILGPLGMEHQDIVRALMGVQSDDNSFYVQPGSYIEKKFFINKKVITAQLWNTSGQEKFWYFNKIFSKDSNIVIYHYSIESKQSFEDLKCFVEDAEEWSEVSSKGIIIANKKYLLENEESNEEETRAFAKNHNYEFYLTSDKEDPINIKNFIEEVIKNYFLYT